MGYLDTSSINTRSGTKKKYAYYVPIKNFLCIFTSASHLSICGVFSVVEIIFSFIKIFLFSLSRLDYIIKITIKLYGHFMPKVWAVNIHKSEQNLLYL